MTHDIRIIVAAFCGFVALAACVPVEPPEQTAARLVGTCVAAAPDDPALRDACLDMVAQQQAIDAQRSAAAGQLGLMLLQQSYQQPPPRQGFTCSTMGAFTNCW